MATDLSLRAIAQALYTLIMSGGDIPAALEAYALKYGGILPANIDAAVEAANDAVIATRVIGGCHGNQLLANCIPLTPNGTGFISVNVSATTDTPTGRVRKYMYDDFPLTGTVGQLRRAALAALQAELGPKYQLSADSLKLTVPSLMAMPPLEEE
jgi:hypothetical protein